MAVTRQMAQPMSAARLFTETLSPDLVAAHAQRAKQLALEQGAKIRDARKKAGFTIEELAEVTHMHFNTLGRIERGTSEANIAQLITLATVLGVDLAQWQHVPAASKNGHPIDQDDFAVIDVLDIQVSAGSGALNGDHQPVERFAFQRQWLRKIGVKPESAKVIRARGDSMADKINDGDVLLVDTAVRQIERDGVYVIEIDGLDYVKLLQRDFATGGVQVISYNQQYATQRLDAGQAADLRISGRVVWHGGEL